MKKFFFIIFVLFAKQICSQANKSISEKLPTINVLALKDDAFEQGKISIKFNRSQLDKIKIEQTTTANMFFNNTALDRLSAEYHFNKYTSLFANILKNTELQARHQHWNLDLWFTIEFDTAKSVKQLYSQLQKLNLFEVVEPVYKKHLLDENATSVAYIPNDPKLNEQWAFNNTGQGNGKVGKDIKLIDAWDIETGKPNVLVAVHDMGIQLNHPDLAQNIAVGKSFNFIDNNTTIVEGYHGTLTSGLIGAVNNNGIGVSSIAGGNGSINSGIRLMSMQVFKGHQGGGFAESFIYAADKGAAISSNSWAYDIEDIYELSTMDAIDYFIENGGGTVLQGGLVIFAAGNNSNDIRFYPSAYDRVICVAATNYRDEKANYSTYGSWVDISAPGGDYSLPEISRVLSTTVGSGYAADHGTSLSCPMVSGVAALIASKLAGKASASDVKNILLSTTDDIDSLNPNFVGFLGTGRLNAFKAMQKAQTIANNVAVDAVTSFKAIYNCSSINLNWQKNNAANDVIIAYSNTNKIDALVNGVVYNVSDKIGEGIIIYKGNASNFVLPSNNEQLHFFKIWSVNANTQYSFGKTAEIVAPVTLYGSGAIAQNFDFPPYFPTQEWRVINSNNDISWIHTAADTANTGAGDLYSMCMYNYQNNPLLGAIDILTSPLYDVKNTDSLHFSFWYAYKYRNTGLPVADSLEVLVSKDCGATYTSLWKKGGQDLATVNGFGDTIFYPFGIDKWKQVMLDISSYKNNKLMFAFREVNGKGNNLFVDNINVDVRYKIDAALVKIISPIDALCNTDITPQIQIKNKGNNTITSLKINYIIDGGQMVLSNWTGNLKKEDSTIVTLNTAVVNAGNHTIKIYSLLPNNLNDEYVLNDTLKSSFFITPTAVLPLVEGFEGNSFPPQGWHTAQNPIDKITWVKRNEFGKNSNSSAVVKNFLYDQQGRIDDLITPVFNIDRNMDSAFLLFDYAYATRSIPITGNDYDTLQISISKDCGESWSTVWKKGGTDLRTTNATQLYNEFLPKKSEWKSDSIMIAGSFSKGDKVQLRFRNIEYFDNNLYIDNIKLYTKYIAPGVKEKGYAIYPNPVNDYLTIQHLTAPSNLQSVRVVSSIGKIVMVKNYNANTTREMQINTTTFANGVYILQMIYSDKTITEKFVKMNK